SFDYVYECEKLRTFSGKKLQKKRNHLNAFYTLYENHYLYESLNANNALECIAFLDEWKKDNEDEFLNQERIGVKRLLRNWDLLPQKGGIIRIDGEIKAFTIGSLLSSNMCQINVEKGDDEIRGIYQAMVKEFLTREFLDCTYVNREDDMGKENIRSAKEAYHPIFMIEKYRLCECEHIV
ncbi:MAG: phosphatidylglycerol lysyltransferase domain-containing protein, partial [Erysipelotrichaceae bacterium]